MSDAESEGACRPCPCPLCGNAESRIRECLSGDVINHLYWRSFAIPNVLQESGICYRHCPLCGLYFFDPMQAGEESLYQRLQSFQWYYMQEKKEFEVARRHLPDSGPILEVGAGEGFFSETVGVERYTGLELNHLAIEKAKRRGIVLLRESVESHTRRDIQYEAVVSFQVLEHVQDPAAFIRGCIDCLRPDGTLILAVPAHEGFVGSAMNCILNMPPHHLTHWTETTLRYLAGQFDLDLVHIEYEPVSRHHERWARKVVLERMLRRSLGMEIHLLDRTLAGRVVSGVSGLLSRWRVPVDLAQERGHTVVVTYKKTAQRRDIS